MRHLTQSKPEVRHDCRPVPGEVGRFYVASRSAAKKGEEEDYIVDVLAHEETAEGTVTGVCPCKGWQVRKTCSHLKDAKIKFVQMEAERMGFPDETAS